MSDRPADDRQPPPSRVPQPISRNAEPVCSPNNEDPVCDRCGGAVFRMHAVWRCSVCGYKSDCCGW